MEVKIADSEEGTEFIVTGSAGGSVVVSSLDQIYLPATVFFALLGVAIFLIADDIAGIVLAGIIIAVLTYIKIKDSVRVENPIVDTKNQRIKNTDGVWFDYTDTSLISLHREISRVKITSNIERERRKNKPGPESSNYKAEWQVRLERPAEEAEVIFAFSQQSQTKLELLSSLGGKFTTLAEQMAETSGLTFVDATGLDRVTREFGTTDLSLQQYLRKNDIIEPYQGELPESISKQFVVEGGSGNYDIKEKDRDLQTGILILVLALAVLDGMVILFISIFPEDPSVQLILYILFAIAIFLSLLIILFLNRVLIAVQVQIFTDSIEFEIRGIFWGYHTKNMPMKELEKIVIFRVLDTHGSTEEIGIEFVSDKERVPLMGGFDKQEAEILRKLAYQLIVSV